MPAQEQARKVGPRSPTPTRSRIRPEPPPVCVLFPRPGIVLLSPPRCIYLPRRLSRAAPHPHQLSYAVQVCLERILAGGRGAGQCVLPAPLPSQALRPSGRDCPAHFFSAHFGAYCSALSLSAAHLCLETFLPGIVRFPTPQPLMDDKQEYQYSSLLSPGYPP